MRIVILVSSCRKNGNTDGISVLLEKELQQLAHDEQLELTVEKYMLGYQNIQICRGCRACFDKGEQFCPLKDDLPKLWEKLREADGIVLGSPVYVEDVNSVMKNWIDRMAFNSHRPGLAGKTAYIYTTSGAGSSGHAIRTMKTALGTWAVYVAGSSRFRAGALSKPEELETRHGAEIKKAAKKLFYAIRNKRPLNPSLFSLVAFTVQQAAWNRTGINKDSLDHRYWEDKGWLKKGCKYYFRHGTNPLKVHFARLAGKIIALFFL